jgi:hypothetical protein
MKVSNAIANAWALDLLARINAGPGPGYLEFYTATQPAGPDTAITTQSLLGTATFSDPAGTVTGRVITFDTIANDADADDTGPVTWARAYDSTGLAVKDLTVGLAGSGPNGGNPDIVINNINIVAGRPILVNSFTVTF